MKRLVLFIAAFVFAFSITVMAADKATITPATVATDAGETKVEKVVDGKAASVKEVKKVVEEKKAEKTTPVAK
jgi:hypothetical protein